jgi:multidrug efflux pump subunit AcrA (membrane-fusion protein)
MIVLLVACGAQPQVPPPAELPQAHAAPAESPARFVGVIVAPRTVELSAQVAGVVHPEHVPLGAAVEAGDLLGWIEVPTLGAELQGAKAAVSSSVVATALGHVQVEHAQRQHDDLVQLVQVGAGAPTDLDQSSLALDRARADQRRTAAAEAEQRALLERLVALRDASRLTAPFAGQISAWWVRDGERVEVGEPVLRLSDPTRLEVRFAVPLQEAAGALGRPIVIFPLPEGQPLRAVVQRVAPELDPPSQLLFVEAALEGGGGVAGQACEVSWAQPSRTTEPSSEPIVRSAASSQ